MQGGGLEEGEGLIQGIEREMLEETAVAPKVGNLLYIQQFSSTHKDFLEFFFHITNGEDYLHIDLSDSTHGSLEIEEIDFIDPSVSNILPVFLKHEDLAAKVESCSPATIFSYVDNLSER